MTERHQSGHEARIDPRAPVRVPGRLFATVSGPGGVEITILNLSGSGALCESPVRCTLGTSARVCMDLPGGSGTPHSIVIEALVVRVEGSGSFITALHFVSVPDRIRTLIRKFVFDYSSMRSAEA